jgi:hypothetical protein
MDATGRFQKHMNSKSIYNRRAKSYRDFFKKCPVVVSCPGAFFWAGEHAVLHGALATCQHLPLRVYVGIEPCMFEKCGIDFSNGINLVYNPVLDEVEDTPPQGTEIQLAREKIISILSNFVEETHLKLKYKNFVIHCMSEFRAKMGCNWSGAFSSALSVAFLLLNDRITLDNLDSWKEEKLESLVMRNDFNLCNRLAWKIETAFHGGRASGYGNFVALVDSQQPVCYFTEERGIEGHPPIDVGNDLGWLDRIKYSGFRFTDVFDLKETKDYPFLFGLLSTGEGKYTSTQILETEKIREHLLDTKTSIMSLSRAVGSTKHRNSAFSNVSSEELLFSRLFASAPSGESLRKYYYYSLTICDEEVFHELQNILTHGTGDKETNLLWLARAMKGVNGNLEQLGVGSFAEKILAAQFYGTMGKENWQKCALKFTGGAGGGMMVFIVPMVAEDKIGKLVDNLNSANREMSMDWFYPIDLLEREGVRVEKDVYNEISINDRFGRVEDGASELLQVRQIDAEVQCKELKVYELDHSVVKREAGLYVDVSSPTKDEWLLLCKGEPLDVSKHKELTFKLILELLRSKELVFEFESLVVGEKQTPYAPTQVASLAANPLTKQIHNLTNDFTFDLDVGRRKLEEGLGRAVLQLGGLTAYVTKASLMKSF